MSYRGDLEAALARAEAAGRALASERERREASEERVAELERELAEARRDVEEVRARLRELEPEVAPTPPAPTRASTPAPAVQPVRRGRRWLMTVPVALAIGVAWLGYRCMHPAGQAEGCRIWDGHTPGAPLIVDIGGQESIVGLCWDPLEGSRMWLLAIDARSVRTRWRSASLGKHEGYRPAHFAVAGPRVVVSDDHAGLRVLELATGRQQRLLTLSDRVERICALPGEQVHVAQVDQRHFTFDPASGELHPGAPPASCLPYDAPRPHAPLSAVEGFSPGDLAEQDGVIVARGVKTPGTALPMAAGYDAATGEVRWTRAIASGDPYRVRADANAPHDLAAGRYVTVYAVDHDRWRAVALDARTGAPLWETRLKDIFAVDDARLVRVTPQHVYITRTSSLDVLDAATGKYRGTVGQETYED